jgi:hypothetical protein
MTEVVRHHPADLRDDHETLTGYLQLVCELHISGEDENQHVTRAKPVALVYGAR